MKKKSNMVLFVLILLVIVEYYILFSKGTFEEGEIINFLAWSLMFSLFAFIIVIPTFRHVLRHIDRIYRVGYRDGWIANKNEAAIFLRDHFPEAYKHLRKNRNLYSVPTV